MKTSRMRSEESRVALVLIMQLRSRDLPAEGTTGTRANVFDIRVPETRFENPLPRIFKFWLFPPYTRVGALTTAHFRCDLIGVEINYPKENSRLGFLSLIHFKY